MVAQASMAKMVTQGALALMAWLVVMPNQADKAELE
jgi:hypothetical protein